jgi:hypothetical protein
MFFELVNCFQCTVSCVHVQPSSHMNSSYPTFYRSFTSTIFFATCELNAISELYALFEFYELE